jgi:hypothetical protein
MRRKTEKVTFENKWGEGKQEGKKKLLHISAHTKDEKSRLDTTIKHDGEMERKREGVHVINAWGGNRKGAKAVAYFCETNEQVNAAERKRKGRRQHTNGGGKEGRMLS